MQLGCLLCAGVGGQLGEVGGPERVLVRLGGSAVLGGLLVGAVRLLSCVALIAHDVPLGAGLRGVVV